MNTPQDFLKRWAELEPERCRTRLAIGHTVRIAELEIFIYPHEKGPRVKTLNRSHILTAVLEAITTHNLRLKLENDSQGQWHSLLMFTELQAAFLGSNPDPGLAILEAYLDWLEFGRDDAEANAGGES